MKFTSQQIYAGTNVDLITLANRASGIDWKLDMFPINDVLQFLRFMILKVMEDDMNAERLSPTPNMDAVWHTLLQRPKQYEILCKTLGDEIIDHNPDGENDRGLQERRDRTYHLFLQYFGQQLEFPRKRARTNFFLDIQRMDGSVFSVDLKQDITRVQELKEKITEIEGVPTDQLRLIYAGQEIHNHKTLKNYGIQSNQLIYLILKLNGC